MSASSSAVVPEDCQWLLRTVYATPPKRFVQKPPQLPVLPHAVWINPPEEQSTSQDRADATARLRTTYGSPCAQSRAGDHGGLASPCRDSDIRGFTRHPHAECLNALTRSGPRHSVEIPMRFPLPFLAHPPYDTVYELRGLLICRACRSINSNNSSRVTTGTPSRFLVPIRSPRVIPRLLRFGVSCRRPKQSPYSSVSEVGSPFL